MEERPRLTGISTLRKVCRMTKEPPSQPTLWRTCRAIANRSRLEIFGSLVRQPGQTVSAVAAGLQLSLSAASEYLRSLEARGLIKVRRAGRKVEYRPGPTLRGGPVQSLAAAMRRTCEYHAHPLETIYRLATAFTHPRRIEIFRVLQPAPKTLAQIKEETRISDRALLRHLRKLEARGFVSCHLGFCSVVKRSDAFGRALARLAAA